MFKKIMITAALIGVSASVMAANRPSGYTTICKIGETCTVSKATNVAFGADDKFVYKVLNGSFSCSVATFGSDPNPAKSVKECSIPSSGTGVSSTSSSKSSVAATSSSKSSVASSSGSTTASGGCKGGAVI